MTCDFGRTAWTCLISVDWWPRPCGGSCQPVPPGRFAHVSIPAGVTATATELEPDDAEQLRAVSGRMVTEQIEYASCCINMTMRDIRLRYKQTFMDLGGRFSCAAQYGDFSLIFMRVATIPTGCRTRNLCVLWAAGLELFRRVTGFRQSLTSNSNLVTKVYFPREIFPLSSIWCAS